VPLAWAVSPVKDRYREERLADDVHIRIRQSSAHPVEYAIVLVVHRERRWHTVCVFDNAHEADEHHEHRYVGAEKQAPKITRGLVNVAMHAALVTLRAAWRDIVRNWEMSR
jgi:hypothetical protein